MYISGDRKPSLDILKRSMGDGGQDPAVKCSSSSCVTPVADAVADDGASYLPLQPYDNQGSYDWTHVYLKKPDFRAVPVKCFPHAPMSECWEHMGVGMKVEVACGAEGVTKDAYWVATVIGIAGYKACLRFEGFVEDNCCDFWVDLCSEEVHPVGWCASQDKPLIPPRSIQDKYSDWKMFLMKRLTGARTLPSNFHSKVLDSHKSRFRPGLNIEVVDKNRIAQMRVATVTEVVGKRLHLRYHGAPPHDDGFWCHEDAPIIHPIGWSREVGHEIVASQSYHEKCISGGYGDNDAPTPLFVQPPTPSFLRPNGATAINFIEGMKLEAIDPLNLSTICVATVMKVMRQNYLMIRIDSYESDNTGSDWFCYHATSPSIFPAGFCQINNIQLTPPKGYEGEFSWYNYLKTTKGTAAPPTLFHREVNSCQFESGMSLEAADLMDPRLVCVATVKAVHGRLLQVHFDGWEDEFDQWIDSQSSDIYPVGWCQMVSYKLEGPRVATEVSAASHRRKPKLRGGRKKRGGGCGTFLTASTDNSSTVGAATGAGTARRGRPPKSKDIDGTMLQQTNSATNYVNATDNNTAASSDAETPVTGSSGSDHWTTTTTTTAAIKRIPASRGRGKRGRPKKSKTVQILSAVAEQSSTGSLAEVSAVPPNEYSDLTPSQLVMLIEVNTEAGDVELMSGDLHDATPSDDDTSSGVASLADSDSWAGEIDDVTEQNLINTGLVTEHMQQFEQSPQTTAAVVSALDTQTASMLQQLQQHESTAVAAATGVYAGVGAIDVVAAATTTTQDNAAATDYMLPQVMSSQIMQQTQEQDKAQEIVLGNPLQDEHSLDLFASDSFPSTTFEDSIHSFSSALQITSDSVTQSSLVNGLNSAANTCASSLGSVTAAQWSDMNNTTANVVASLTSPSIASLGGVGAILNTNTPATMLPCNIVPLPNASYLNTNILTSNTITNAQLLNTAVLSNAQITSSASNTLSVPPGTVLVNNCGIVTCQPIAIGGNNCLPAICNAATIAATVESQSLYIPRLLDGPIKDGSKVQPKLWTSQDVGAFLEKNDCATYSPNFLAQNIDGSALLALNQQHSRVMELTGMKVGPSVKIQDLVKQLVALVSPAQARYQATLLKRSMAYNRT
uniref:Polycomb protein Sfmbt-like n=1 Tax=Hirondellea gigas TaxID=1518452 RepID=A0A2P2I2R2_9CRUS